MLTSLSLYHYLIVKYSLILHQIVISLFEIYLIENDDLGKLEDNDID